MEYYAVTNWRGEYEMTVEAVCDTKKRALELQKELSKIYAGIEIHKIKLNELIEL